MKSSLKGKLILSFLAIALVTVLVITLVIRLTSGQSLMELVKEQQTAQLEEAVQTYYLANGSLDGFFGYYTRMNRSEPDMNPAPNAPDQPPQSRDLRGVRGLVDANYQAIIPTFDYAIGDTVPEGLLNQSTPVEVDGQVVAYIIPDTKFQFALSAEEEVYLQRTTLAISLAAIAAVVLAVSMGYFLANGLVRPIRRLTKASQELAKGELHNEVPVTSQDELGQLTATFNQMSAKLIEADQQRKRLTADITHDLSTPLQVISGYMEMLEEGEVELTPQRIETIKTEIEHLRRLVGDLSTLSQVDASELDIQFQPVQPDLLMERVFHIFEPIAAKKGVELTLDTPAVCPNIMVDEGRMMQVLKNLVENALRYTSKGGMVSLSVSAESPIQLRVSDNGTGIDAEDLPYVFDRFFQAEKSRNANAGKMGLGLAICKALVSAQSGKIHAESAGKGKGTTMVITFEPVSEH